MAPPPRKSAAPKKSAPKKKAAAKKGAGRPRALPPGVTIETLVNNASVKVTRTTMQPGTEIPQQGRGSDYVILPVTEYTCVRRFLRNGKVVREVTLPGTPGEPYHARAAKGTAEFALANTGKTPAVFHKVVIKRA